MTTTKRNPQLELPPPPLAAYFETRKRPSRTQNSDDTEFVTLIDSAPQWLQAAIRDAHDGLLPNDWIWAECRAACEAIDTGDFDINDEDDIEWVACHAEARTEVYTHELFMWAADLCHSSLFWNGEEYLREIGTSEDASIANRLRMIQNHAIEAVMRTMINAVREARK